MAGRHRSLRVLDGYPVSPHGARPPLVVSRGAPIGYESESRIFAAHFDGARIERAQLLPGPHELPVTAVGGSAEGFGCDGMQGTTTDMLYICGREDRTPTCYGSLDLHTRAYEGQNLLPTPEESRGDCDNHEYTEPEEVVAPELEAMVEEELFVVRHLGGPRSPRVGRWTRYSSSSAALPATPEGMACPD